MNYIENVFEIAETFMALSKDVQIDWVGVESTVALMKEAGEREFKESMKPNVEFWEMHNECFLQLVGGAINYCYWYGRYNVRPNDCSSSKMFKCVRNAAPLFTDSFKVSKDYRSQDFIQELVKLLSYTRFPLLEEREKHLKELIKDGEKFIDLVVENKNIIDLNYILEPMIGSFPGYASDIFLKRASLFFIMLYRQFGWFKEALNTLHVPADYQIPKMLKYYNCLSYSKDLQNKINNGDLIPKHSRVECEIRAATILVCKELVEKTGWNIADVDGWFWLKRNKCDDPFHLCITTDY